MGRDLRDAAVRHLPRPAADDRFGVPALPARTALVHGGLLHELFPADRTIPLHPSDRPFPGRQRVVDRRGDRRAAPPVPLRAAARCAAPAPAAAVAGLRAFFRRKRRALPAGGGCGSRHPHDGRLVQGRSSPAGAGTQPHAGRTAKPQKPAQPPFSVQYAQQHLFAHPDRRRPRAAGRPRPEPDAALRALRKQLPHGAAGRRGRVPARLHRTDAHPPAAPRGSRSLAARRTVADARGPAAVHLADRECLQTRHEQRQTVVHPDRHPRARRRTGLPHPQQLFPQDGFGSERFGHRTEKLHER